MLDRHAVQALLKAGTPTQRTIQRIAQESPIQTVEEVVPGIRTAKLGGPNPFTEGQGVMGNRRSFSAEFKAKVALEALVGDKTLAELAAKHNVHPNMITQWKRQAKESLPEVFAKKGSRGAADREAEVKALTASTSTAKTVPSSCLRRP